MPFLANNADPDRRPAGDISPTGLSPVEAATENVRTRMTPADDLTPAVSIDPLDPGQESQHAPQRRLPQAFSFNWFRLIGERPLDGTHVQVERPLPDAHYEHGPVTWDPTRRTARKAPDSSWDEVFTTVDG